MALSISQTAALGRVLQPGMRVASMGYPDIIASLDVVEYMLGDQFSRLRYREDSEEICKRHGLQHRRIPDAHSFFIQIGARLGGDDGEPCRLDVYDVIRERGCEIICDLNGRLDPALRAFNYDIVLDVGTAEHCFNIAQTIINMAGMVKMGGYIIHENPFNWGNHGFYNLNPTFYADFYAANGFKLEECKLVTKDGRKADIPYTKRFVYTEAEVNVFAMARRTAMQTFVFPVQSKYAPAIAAAGLDRAKEQAHG